MLVGFDEDSREIVVGIIDYLRQYDTIKKIERLGKSVTLLAGEPTIIQPTDYRRRFSAAMERYFLAVPDKWTHPSTWEGYHSLTYNASYTIFASAFYDMISICLLYVYMYALYVYMIFLMAQQYTVCMCLLLTICD